MMFTQMVSIIKRDITRTFPGHPFFASEKGQKALEDVLIAYSVFDPVVQYCQGEALPQLSKENWCYCQEAYSFIETEEVARVREAMYSSLRES